jgi:hypothetical protein
VSHPFRLHETGLSWYQRAWGRVKVEAPKESVHGRAHIGFLRHRIRPIYT